MESLWWHPRWNSRRSATSSVCRQCNRCGDAGWSGWEILEIIECIAKTVRYLILGSLLSLSYIQSQHNFSLSDQHYVQCSVTTVFIHWIIFMAGVPYTSLMIPEPRYNSHKAQALELSRSCRPWQRPSPRHRRSGSAAFPSGKPRSWGEPPGKDCPYNSHIWNPHCKICKTKSLGEPCPPPCRPPCWSLCRPPSPPPCWQPWIVSKIGRGRRVNHYFGKSKKNHPIWWVSASLIDGLKKLYGRTDKRILGVGK